jgi:hypothetical protein
VLLHVGSYPCSLAENGRNYTGHIDACDQSVMITVRVYPTCMSASASRRPPGRHRVSRPDCNVSLPNRLPLTRPCPSRSGTPPTRHTESCFLAIRSAIPSGMRSRAVWHPSKPWIERVALRVVSKILGAFLAFAACLNPINFTLPLQGQPCAASVYNHSFFFFSLVGPRTTLNDGRDKMEVDARIRRTSRRGIGRPREVTSVEQYRTPTSQSCIAICISRRQS